MIFIEYSYLSAPAKIFKTGDDSILIGRSTASWVVDLDLSPDPTVSRRHARLTYEKDGYWLEDVGSRGGTELRGQKIEARTQVWPGDQIKVGQTRLLLRDPEATVPGQENDLEKTQPIAADQEESPPEEGVLTSSISATAAPSNLLLSDKTGQEDGLIKLVEQRLNAFYELGAALSSAGAVDPLLETVVQHLCKAIPGAQRGALLLRDGRKLHLKAYVPEKLKPSISLYLARLAINKEEAFTWRYGAPGEMGRLTDSIVWHGTKCAMYAPLIWQGEVLGIVYVDNYISGDAFKEDDLHLLMAMASQAAMFVKNHALQEDLRHQEVVRSNLLRQFSPPVAEHLEAMLRERGQLGLGGERIEPVTVLNSDVRGFTALSAQMDPSQVMEMLNQLFGVCIPIIFKYNGTVDKYIGDAILAVFGSPEPDERQWENAVRASLEMQHAVKRLGWEWQELDRPEFRIGIGVHTGAVLQGFIGSNEQIEYTVIGDTVNRTSRYCSGAGPGEIIISPAVHSQVSNLVETTSTIIPSKHPDTEADLDAYLVKGLTTQLFQSSEE